METNLIRYICFVLLLQFSRPSLIRSFFHIFILLFYKIFQFYINWKIIIFGIFFSLVYYLTIYLLRLHSKMCILRSKMNNISQDQFCNDGDLKTTICNLITREVRQTNPKRNLIHLIVASFQPLSHTICICMYIYTISVLHQLKSEVNWVLVVWE